MFIQIVQGPVRDAARFGAEADRWRTDLKPGARGYLGCTWGTSSDGTGFIAARFDSALSAKSNSTRPEQDAWWQAIEPSFEQVAFRDCDDVELLFGGGTNHAGFVQVIQGRVHDVEAARVLMRRAETRLAVARPDILGGWVAWHGHDGDFTQVMYFESEAAARSGETAPEEGDVGEEYRSMMAVEPAFLDLPEPHFD